MKKRTRSAIFAATLVYQTAASASPLASVPEEGVARSEDCGIAAKIPADLTVAGHTQFQPCGGTYKSAAGAIFSFAPSDNEVHDPNWLDRIPALRVRQVPIDLERRSEFGRNFSNTPAAPKECNVTGNTKIRNISGKNWRGWLAEDIYMVSYRGHRNHNEYCVFYSPEYRCVRVLMGNAKESATMAQYCLSSDDQAFDLDAGINFKIFMEIIDSIEFVEK